MKDNLLICNEAAAKRWQAEIKEISEALQGKKQTFDIVLAKSKDDVIQQSELAAEKGYKNLLVLGGDGTLHLAIQGMMKQDFGVVFGRWRLRIPFSGRLFSGSLLESRNC